MHSNKVRYIATGARINILVHVSVCLMVLASMFIRFLYPDRGYLSFFHDDFYYYLKIAENIYYYGLSSFNNITATNGYHPLWMFFLVILLSVFKGSNIYFFLAVSLLISISNILIFITFNKILKYFIDNTTVSVLLSGYLTTFALLISKGGMEVHITILMICFLIYYWLKSSEKLDNEIVVLKFGFISSVLFLSRLDSAIFIAVFVLLLFIKCKSIMDSFKIFLFYSLGGIMVPIYLFFNNFIFGTFVPISGHAKQLKSTNWPTTEFFLSTMNFIMKVYEGLLFILPTIMVTIIALIIVIMNYKVFFKITEINILIIVMVFPFVFMSVQSVISDWPPWIWYYYPLVTSCLAAFIVLYIYVTQIKNFKINQALISVLLALALILSFYSAYKRNISADSINNSIYTAAIKLAEKFANDTTTTLAMGDRAGMAGYLLQNPIVHLEGLVMDEKFLQCIKKEENLLRVLKKYKVNYYIATNPKPMKNGCYELLEPRKAGNYSPKMRAIMCQEPFFEFWTGNYHTAIFRINY